MLAISLSCRAWCLFEKVSTSGWLHTHAVLAWSFTRRFDLDFLVNRFCLNLVSQVWWVTPLSLVHWIGLAHWRLLFSAIEIMHNLGSYLFVPRDCLGLFFYLVVSNVSHSMIVFMRLIGTSHALSHPILWPHKAFIFHRVLLWLHLSYHNGIDLFLHLQNGVHHGHFCRCSLFLMQSKTSLDKV